jgi:histidine ammonia-lyase
MQHRQNYPEQFDQLANRIAEIDNMLARADLRRMINHAQDIWIKLDKALVDCRRLNRYTLEYQHTEAALVEQLRQTSKWLTLALLKY